MRPMLRTNHSVLEALPRMETEEPLWRILIHCHVANWLTTKASAMCLLCSSSRTLLEVCQLPPKCLVKRNFQVPVLLSAASIIKESLCRTVIWGSCSELTVKYPPACTPKARFLLLFQIPSIHLPFHCKTATPHINTIIIADSS